MDSGEVHYRKKNCVMPSPLFKFLKHLIKMNSILQKLTNARKGPFVSMIIPTFRLSRDRMQNPEILKKAVRKAKSALKRMAGIEYISEMINDLDKLALQFNPDKAAEGLGIFISPGIAEMIYFPFKVKEKIIVNDSSFETRDLLYMDQLLIPYYTLVLTKKSVRLFSSQGNQLNEIRDGNFPMEYVEEYEYARSSLGSSVGYGYKGFDKDKSELSKIRQQSFYKEAFSHLALYLSNSRIPLLVAGTREQLASFLSAKNSGNHIAGTFTGTYSDKNFNTLSKKAFISINHYVREQVKRTIENFKEKNGRGRIACGIKEVWEAAQEGRGQQLLVDKDYHCTGYLRDDDQSLHLRAPKGKYTLVHDAVDDTIETVIEKGGEVIFTDAKQLDAFDYIAMELRY